VSLSMWLSGSTKVGYHQPLPSRSPTHPRQIEHWVQLVSTRLMIKIQVASMWTHLDTSTATPGPPVWLVWTHLHSCYSLQAMIWYTHKLMTISRSRTQSMKVSVSTTTLIKHHVLFTSSTLTLHILADVVVWVRHIVCLSWILGIPTYQ